MTQPWRSAADWVIDGGLAAFSLFAAVVLHAEVVGGSRAVTLSTGLAVAAVHGGAVLWRRRHPVVVVAVLLVTAWWYVALGFPTFMLGPGIVFVMYSAAAVLPVRTAVAILALVEVNVVALLLLGPRFPGPGSLVLYCGILASAWGLGELVSRWRAAAVEHARRADELTSTREELARVAVTEERRRIARELHDVVAHAMTVVALQAGTGRIVAASDPVAAAGTLSTIERMSREALSEMRRLVSLLRDDTDDHDLLSPSPGLVDLHQLVAEVVKAGLVVDVQTEGPLDKVPPGPAVAAYRIIQEALTNVVRHAGTVRAELRVVVSDEALSISVTNPPERGTGVASGPDGGVGLVGMRERVELYDGRFTAGLLPNGDYRVEAWMPVDLDS